MFFHSQIHRVVFSLWVKRLHEVVFPQRESNTCIAYKFKPLFSPTLFGFKTPATGGNIPGDVDSWRIMSVRVCKNDLWSKRDIRILVPLSYLMKPRNHFVKTLRHHNFNIVNFN